MSTNLQSPNRDLHLTRFFGGKDRGVCLQVSVCNAFAQLSRDEIVAVVGTLAHAFSITDDELLAAMVDSAERHEG